MVAFSSNAINLVKVGSGRTRDVFVKVLSTGKTSIVSVRTDEQLGSNDSSLEDVSNSGRYVLMQSYSALVKNDTNNTGDVFLRDRTGGTTIRVSRDGSTQSNNQSFAGAISDDGSHIAFQTWATNLGPGPDTNGVLTDVLEYELATGDLARLSANADGGWSDDASYDAAIALAPSGANTLLAAIHRKGHAQPSEPHKGPHLPHKGAVNLPLPGSPATHGLRGHLQLQISTPSVSIPEGPAGRAAVSVELYAWFQRALNGAPAPEFLHGTLRFTTSLATKTIDKSCTARGVDLSAAFPGCADFPGTLASLKPAAAFRRFLATAARQ
jgi:hypothetical protein